jgi:hypothetical protein
MFFIASEGVFNYLLNAFAIYLLLLFLSINYLYFYHFLRIVAYRFKKYKLISDE